MRKISPRLCVLLALAAGAFGFLPMAHAADALPQVRLNADKIAPRPIEELTGNNIVRDYSLAWQSLAEAMDQNRAELLDAYFTGFAKDRFSSTVADQKKNGLRTRYIDHGHNVQAFFYSPNGDAMQLRDTAQLEIQLFDGSKMIRQENVTLHYLVIMTPGADRWEVRSLEAVPNF
ncbi:MAG TPA: hypothetical protein VFA89_09510 [Terriglobales bacterium]|nr:hypothetical protein [Terriglobales bacterium]